MRISFINNNHTHLFLWGKCCHSPVQKARTLQIQGGWTLRTQGKRRTSRLNLLFCWLQSVSPPHCSVAVCGVGQAGLHEAVAFCILGQLSGSVSPRKMNRKPLIAQNRANCFLLTSFATGNYTASHLPHRALEQINS